MPVLMHMRIPLPVPMPMPRPAPVRKHTPVRMFAHVPMPLLVPLLVAMPKPVVSLWSMLTPRPAPMHCPCPDTDTELHAAIAELQNRHLPCIAAWPRSSAVLCWGRRGALRDSEGG